MLRLDLDEQRPDTSQQSLHGAGSWWRAAGDTTACRSSRPPRPPLHVAASQRSLARAPLPAAVPVARRRRRRRRQRIWTELGTAGGPGGRGGGRRGVLRPRAGVPGWRRRRGRPARVRVQHLLRRAGLLHTHAQLHRRRRQREPAVPRAILAAARGGQRHGGLRVAPHELRHHRRRDPVRGAREPDPAAAQRRRQRRRRPSPTASTWSSPPAPRSSSTRWCTRSPRTPAPPRHRPASAPPRRTTRCTGRRRRCSTGTSTGGPGQRPYGQTRSRNSTEGVIEFVASPNNPDAQLPNNPDAQLCKPVLGGSAAAIVDHAYYWPHFTHIPAPADEDVMMFTASKLSGHAGSRFGWALVKDESVAKRAYSYMQSSSFGASRDTQLRMLGIVKLILAHLDGEDDIFAFGHDVMRGRWRRLSAVVSRSRRISLQNIPPGYCTYFKRIREPSPAYAWVKCEREEDEDCHGALRKARIITRSGVGSEASSRYTRISLLKSDDDFEVLMERVTDLVDAEKYDAPGSTSNSV